MSKMTKLEILREESSLVRRHLEQVSDNGDAVEFLKSRLRLVEHLIVEELEPGTPRILFLNVVMP